MKYQELVDLIKESAQEPAKQSVAQVEHDDRVLTELGFYWYSGNFYDTTYIGINKPLFSFKYKCCLGSNAIEDSLCVGVTIELTDETGDLKYMGEIETYGKWQSVKAQDSLEKLLEVLTNDN